ncbi:gephyrin-like molybdotransferase Glp [Thalassospira profundimaris]|uniref:molybdopterin molybdotransferase MoeA n=1 Tax=Thalassospira profundimaris TaxID=502049 RepID=UPI000DEDE504|nr:gephyrin-like molybdotransferase Glp [Thalassospira profundimaris]
MADNSVTSGSGSQPGLTPLDVALRLACEQVPVSDLIETRELTECHGAILREDVIAAINVPSVDNSAMDGYALRMADLALLPQTGALTLPVAGVALAGHPFIDEIPTGRVVRIATGAAIPHGADAVIIQENVAASADESEIRIERAVIERVRQGDNIRRAGEDVKQGTVLLPAGKRLRPQDVAVAAGQGRAHLVVARPLRVAVFSTGDELAAPGGELPPGGIYDSNRFAMIGMMRAIGCDVTDLGLLRDDFAVLQAALSEAADNHDVILTSGGVSVGKADLLKPVVDSLGSIEAWKLAIKPGKPLMRGRIGDCLVLGLPGNPVSVMVSGLLYAVPLLLHMMGARIEDRAIVRFPMPAGFNLKRRTGRREWLRARLHRNGNGQMVALPFHSSSSGVLSSMVWAEGLIELAEDRAGVQQGEIVDYIPFAGLQAF